jgi:hypothetical protein
MMELDFASCNFSHHESLVLYKVSDIPILQCCRTRTGTLQLPLRVKAGPFVHNTAMRCPCPQTSDRARGVNTYEACLAIVDMHELARLPCCCWSEEDRVIRPEQPEPAVRDLHCEC